MGSKTNIAQWKAELKQKGILTKTVWDPQSETDIDTRWDPKHIPYHEKANWQQSPQCWTIACNGTQQWNGTTQC